MLINPFCADLFCDSRPRDRLVDNSIKPRYRKANKLLEKPQPEKARESRRKLEVERLHMYGLSRIKYSERRWKERRDSNHISALFQHETCTLIFLTLRHFFLFLFWENPEGIVISVDEKNEVNRYFYIYLFLYSIRRFFFALAQAAVNYFVWMLMNMNEDIWYTDVMWI